MALLAQDLREAVLQAAFEGKLTYQLETDSSKDYLVKKIREDKIEISNKKNARQDKIKGEISQDEALIATPNRWALMRLGEIGIYKKGPFGSALTKGMFVPKSEETVKVYEQKNAIQKDATLGEYYIKKQYYDEKMKGFTVEPGDIIVSCAGTIGESYVLPPKIELGIINQALMRMTITKYINIKYFLLYFDFVLKAEARGKSKGGAIKNIPPFDVLKNLPVPIPSTEEQQRIVERVEELMSKIDEFEKIENKLESLKKSFPEDMKASLLQSAMQGKLTEQLDTDTSVEVGEEIPKEEIPFNIPKSWKWTYLNNIATINGGFAFKSSKYSQNGARVIRISDFNEAGFVDTNIVRYNYTDDLEQYIIEDKNILLCMTGGTVGKSLFVDNVPEKMLSNQRVATIKIDGALPEYVYKAILSPFIQQMIDDSKNSTNDNISMTLIKNFPIPVPPIEEQQRIVNKLNELLLLCNMVELSKE